MKTIINNERINIDHVYDTFLKREMMLDKRLPGEHLHLLLTLEDLVMNIHDRIVNALDDAAPTGSPLVCDFDQSLIQAEQDEILRTLNTIARTCGKSPLLTGVFNLLHDAGVIGEPLTKDLIKQRYTA